MPTILNLGVLAHVDAGKTSLTERILFESGAITTLGSVDSGTTHTDSMPLEQQRGITIRAAVASLQYNGCHINLLDTPGHPDFIAEVERSLSVLDAVVLVISSVEGVQPQTRRLARAITSLGLPCVIFCNKVDRTGAREESLLSDIEWKLGFDLLPLSTTTNIGTQQAQSNPLDICAERVIAKLAEHDDDLFQQWVDNAASIQPDGVSHIINAATQAGKIAPVIFGSAVTGAGVQQLLQFLSSLATEDDDSSDDLASQVFKIERDKRGERVVLARVWSGELKSREVYPIHRDGVRLPDTGSKISRLERCIPGGSDVAQCAGPGEIVRIYGLTDARVGDVIGGERPSHNRLFRPVFETVVREKDASQRHDLLLALNELADQDPFISLRFDPRAGTTSVRLFGEVQREVIEDALLREFQIPVVFEESTIICIERPIGSGESLERIGGSGNPFLAGVGLVVRPGSENSGVTYTRSQQSLGKLPHSMYVGIEESVFTTLHEGLLGWEVTDIEVELTFVEYVDAGSVVADFRGLTPLVLMDALSQAQTEVCEPLQQFRSEVPEDRLAESVRRLVQNRAAIVESVIEGDGAIISGEIPAASVPSFEHQLPGISRGEGEFDSWHIGWQPIASDPPSRSRTDLNPLDRAEYLSRIAGRM